MNELKKQYGKALFEAAFLDESDKVLKKELDEVIANFSDEKDQDIFLKSINQSLFSSFDEIYAGFLEKYNEKYSSLAVHVISAFPLFEEELDYIRKKLEDATAKTIILTWEENKDLLGGIVLQFDGTEIDGSLLGRLNQIKKTII